MRSARRMLMLAATSVLVLTGCGDGTAAGDETAEPDDATVDDPEEREEPDRFGY